MTGADERPRRDKPKCGGKKRGPGGGLCTRPAGWGTSHPRHGKCKLHGGSTASHTVAAHREIAEQAVKTYGLPREIDPTEALLEEVHATAGHIAWLRERIQELEAEALIWGKTEEIDKGSGEFTGVDTTRAAVPHVWLDLYQRERKHLVDVAKACISAGIDERRVKLAEQMGSKLAGVIRAVVDVMNPTAEQRAAADEELLRQLSALAPGLGGAG